MTLQKNDIALLERYWMNYKELVSQVERNEFKSNQHKERLCTIVNAIDALYVEADEMTQGIITMRYWDESDACYDWEEIADTLFISRNKALRKRTALLERTAKHIGWV